MTPNEQLEMALNNLMSFISSNESEEIQANARALANLTKDGINILDANILIARAELFLTALKLNLNR